MDESRADEPVALFGANLRRFREAYGWSQSELARQMQESGWPKYSQVAVSRTEEGTRAVRLDEAISLARLFNRKLEDLLDPKGVIDHWQRLRFTIDDYSNKVTLLRNVVDDLQDLRIFVAMEAEMLKEQIESAGGWESVSETMVKTLSNAELLLQRSTVDLVEGAVRTWTEDAESEDDDGEHQETS